MNPTVQRRRSPPGRSKRNNAVTRAGLKGSSVFLEKESTNYEEETFPPLSLQKLFGKSSSISKLLDFLTLYRRFDYSLTEISQNSGVPWRTLHRIWPVLERYGIVKLTREVGRAKLYTFNKDSDIAKLLTRLSLKIAEFDREVASTFEPQHLIGKTLPVEEALAEVDNVFVRAKGSNHS